MNVRPVRVAKNPLKRQLDGLSGELSCKSHFISISWLISETHRKDDLNVKILKYWRKATFFWGAMAQWLLLDNVKRVRRFGRVLVRKTVK